MGDQSNFVLVPMLAAAIKQLLEWGVDNIQAYCAELTQTPLKHLQEIGVLVADPAQRPAHLVGLHLPERYFDRERLKNLLQERQVYVSWRGEAIRISTHLYNTPEDWDTLVTCIEQVTKAKV